MVGAFLIVFIVGFLCGLVAEQSYPSKPQASTATSRKLDRSIFNKMPQSWKLWDLAKPAAPTQPMASIPRTRGPWRRQRIELQKQHNSKQKERDALTQGASHVPSQTR